MEKTAWVSSLLFCGVTLWAVTVRGIFEPARLGVPHFEAGAGDEWLLVRAALATIATLALAASALFARPPLARVFLGLFTLLVVPVFFWSCLAFERWAPHFSESSFTALLQRHFAGQSLAEDDLVSELGRPLFTGLRPSGETVWSYSYMPSSGFGWHKRIFWLSDGRVTRGYSLDEP